jgi:putative membrane protein
MTRPFKTFATGAFAVLLSSAATYALADADSDFVDDASAKGIAEIQAGQLALQKGSSADVKKFAQMMVDDHTAANEKLKSIAQQKNLKVADDAELMNKAKAMVLKLRDGESFDKAYANNQVVAHEQTIDSFKKEVANGKDADVKSFASQTLPKLEAHLKAAKALAAAHGGDAAKQ